MSIAIGFAVVGGLILLLAAAMLFLPHLVMAQVRRDIENEERDGTAL